MGRLRVTKRVSQADMAQATGLSVRTYRRLEAGQIDNPPIRYLTNVALALDVPLAEVLEDEWAAWTSFGGGTPTEAPAPGWEQQRGASWLRSPHARHGAEDSDR